MPEKNTSLAHLLFLSLFTLATSADGEQACTALGQSSNALKPSWTACSDEASEHGLELLQRRGQKVTNSHQELAGNKHAANVSLLQQNVSLTKPVSSSSGDGKQAVLLEEHTNQTKLVLHNNNVQHARNDYVTTTFAQLGVVAHPTLGPAYQKPRTPTNPWCNHELSGVDDKTLVATLEHKKFKATRAYSNIGQLRSLQQQRIFIVACLHQNEPIMPHWTSELVRLLMSLRVGGNARNFFVSVYESGSTDKTADHLHGLKDHLDFLGVRSKIVTGGETRDARRRIEFLAHIRNKAMEPLQETTDVYDHVFWLSDNLFCADGVLQMLAHAMPEKKGGLGADAVCGMDYSFYSGGGNRQCIFYDRWASHDIAGNNFANTKPIVQRMNGSFVIPGPGNAQLEAGEPFQVFSCWNAMAVFNADIFQKERLVFRTNREQLKECPAAETELIFRDMWSIGRGKILVSPTAATAYNDYDFRECAREKQPGEFHRASKINWQAAPTQVSCCPLEPGQEFVTFELCHPEHWNRFGRYQPQDSTVASLLNKDLLAFPAASLVDTQTDQEVQATSISVLGAIGAFALVVFVVCSFLHLKGLKSSIKELKDGDLQANLAFWMCMSLLMNLLNKKCTILLSCPFTLVLIQMLVTICLLARTPMSGIRMEDLWRWCILALLFGVMLCSSMFAFTYASVTCLLILRNCQPILTLFLENALLPNAPRISFKMVLSLLSVALGAYMYARFAPGYSVTANGLGWILINCLATVLHRVLERHILTSDMRLSFEAMTLINNVVPLVPVAVLAWATGETLEWSSYGHLFHSPFALAIISCSGVVGLCLGQSSIMIQACVSATSMTVLQTMNKLFIILAAMVVFRERFTPLSCIGCALSLIGCVAYGMAQQAAKNNGKAPGHCNPAAAGESDQGGEGVAQQSSAH